jgi:hypothetical protein
MRLCYVNLCIDHGVLDVDMRIARVTMYPHGCEGVHIICTLGIGKRYFRSDLSNDSPCIWAFQKQITCVICVVETIVWVQKSLDIVLSRF